MHGLLFFPATYYSHQFTFTVVWLDLLVINTELFLCIVRGCNKMVTTAANYVTEGQTEGKHLLLVLLHVVARKREILKIYLANRVQCPVRRWR